MVVHDSTSARPGLPSNHLKQIRHRSLIRMLHCLLRRPLSASKQLPGLARSLRLVAASSWSSLREAARSKPKKAAILLSLKPTIKTLSGPTTNPMRALEWAHLRYVLQLECEQHQSA